MIAALEPLHEELERVSRCPEAYIARLLTYGLQGPQTARETSFIQAFGRELHEAREATRRYQKYGEIKDLDNAWDIYFAVRTRSSFAVTISYSLFHKVFKKVEKQLPQLTTLDLQYVSPELLKARNLELAVPGTCC
jgi:serine/threonine-protein kinase mTOR